MCWGTSAAGPGGSIARRVEKQMGSQKAIGMDGERMRVIVRGTDMDGRSK